MAADRFLQWGLPNRARLVRPAWVSAGELCRYMIGELGRVGDMATVALLHAYLPDPELGPLAVEAIRAIERRLAQRLTEDGPTGAACE